jgi:hypothetical protein
MASIICSMGVIPVPPAICSQNFIFEISHQQVNFIPATYLLLKPGMPEKKNHLSMVVAQGLRGF